MKSFILKKNFSTYFALFCFLCLVLCLVVGVVPQILMQDKINAIIAAENRVEMLPEAAPAEEE